MASEVAEKPARHQSGGIFESRGKLYIRVTVAPRTRPAKLLPWCTSLPDAEASRARGPGARQRPSRRGRGLVDRERREGGRDRDGRRARRAPTQRREDRRRQGGARRGAARCQRADDLKAFAMQWVRGELAALYPDYVERKRSAYVGGELPGCVFDGVEAGLQVTFAWQELAPMRDEAGGRILGCDDTNPANPNPTEPTPPTPSGADLGSICTQDGDCDSNLCVFKGNSPRGVYEAVQLDRRLSGRLHEVG